MKQNAMKFLSELGREDLRGTLSRSSRVALSLWLVRIPLSYLFVVVLGFGVVSVWWSMNFSQFLQAFLITKRYLIGKWLQPIH